VLSSLFTMLVETALVEFAYDAEMACLYHGMSSMVDGLILQVYGYNDKLLVLLEAILDKVMNLDVEAESFHAQRQKLEDGYRNFYLGDPYNIAIDKSNRLLQDVSYQKEGYAAIAQALTPEDLVVWMPQLLQKGFLKAFVHGNMTQEGAIGLVETCVAKLAMQPLAAEERQFLHRRAIKLPDAPCESRHHITLANPSENNSATVVFLQVGNSDIRKIALGRLFALAIMNPCFEDLRTKQQLGYIVFSGMSESFHVASLRFIVQSDNTAPNEVYRRIMTFLNNFITNDLANCPDEQFDTVRNGLIAKLHQKDQSLEEECMRHWRNIEAGMPMDFKDRLIAALRTFTKEDLAEFVGTFFGENKRVLLVAAHGSRHPIEMDQEGVTYINDLAEFKAGLDVYPRVTEWE